MLKYIKRVIKYVLYGIPVQKCISVDVTTIGFNNLLEGKVALITGGTSGIGKSIAEAFMRSGANVIVTGRTYFKVEAVCKELNEGHNLKTKAFPIELDNTQPFSFEKKLNDILKFDGVTKIDILVNNAGMCGGDISNTTVEEFDAVINTNMRGAFFLSRVVSNYMKNKGIKGNILNIASSSSLRPAASAYTLSKWGIRGLTLGLAKTLAPYDIVVNGIAPGPTATPMLNRDTSNISFNNPSGRYALPEEVANMAVVLVSNMGRMVVGDIVYMTGGSGLITFDDITYNL